MRTLKAFSLLFCLSLCFLHISCGESVQWQELNEENFETALQSGKPVIVEFYAAWCPPCMKMKHETFTDARVIEALDPFVRLKFDGSRRTDEKVKAANAAFNIQGYPTVIFFNSRGEEMHDLRTGFFSADSLLKFIDYYRGELFVS